jgi:hypothetical protein
LGFGRPSDASFSSRRLRRRLAAQLVNDEAAG